MAYVSVPLKSLIDITDIVTVHYFEYSCDFSFAGESHDFWEFLCVDKGEIEVAADEQCYTLTRGDIIFHKPNEFHRLTANHRVAPNLVVISFCCNSPAMDFFRDSRLVIDDYERQLLARIITEAKQTFADPLDNPYQTHMELRPYCPTGSSQMIKILLEAFLLHLLRRYENKPSVPSATETIRRKKDDEDYHRIISYLTDNLSTPLTLDQIAKDTLMAKSRLQLLIRKRHDCGVIDLFAQLKIEEARHLIRENRMNFTEISICLGYSSIHYFSRQFKKLTGMTPSEYSSSIKGLAEGRNNHSFV